MPLPKEFNGSYYDDDYFHNAMKGFRKPDGSFGTFGYCCDQNEWKLWMDIVLWLQNNLVKRHPNYQRGLKTVLDFGCGTGGFVHACLRNGIEAFGFDYSKWAIEHTTLPNHWRGRALHYDITQNMSFEEPVDLVTGWDLMEHIYEEDVPQVIVNMKNASRKFMAFKICTAQRDDEVKSTKRGEKVSQNWEWLLVSGHVNSRLESYWIKKLEDKNWKINWGLTEDFIVDLQLYNDWRFAPILERVK